jgi:hypothetical protein
MSRDPAPTGITPIHLLGYVLECWLGIKELSTVSLTFY